MAALDLASITKDMTNNPDAYAGVSTLDEAAGVFSSRTSQQIQDDPYGWFLKHLDDPANMDKFTNYVLSEKSQQSARDWTAQREDTQYQRLVDDVKAAGINPYLLLNSGISPVSSAAVGNHYSGSEYSTNYRHSKDYQIKIVKAVLSAVIPVIGSVISAVSDN